MKYLTFLTSSWAQSRLTVAEVNGYLDDLADSNLKKDRPGVKRALQMLLRNASALEQKRLIRIILKVLYIHVCVTLCAPPSSVVG